MTALHKSTNTWHVLTKVNSPCDYRISAYSPRKCIGECSKSFILSGCHRANGYHQRYNGLKNEYMMICDENQGQCRHIAVKFYYYFHSMSVF